MQSSKSGKRKPHPLPPRKPFIYAWCQFGAWNVFIDGIALRGTGFGGLAEFSTEREALEAGAKAEPQPSPFAPSVAEDIT